MCNCQKQQFAHHPVLLNQILYFILALLPGVVVAKVSECGCYPLLFFQSHRAHSAQFHLPKLPITLSSVIQGLVQVAITNCLELAWQHYASIRMQSCLHNRCVSEEVD